MQILTSVLKKIFIFGLVAGSYTFAAQQSAYMDENIIYEKEGITIKKVHIPNTEQFLEKNSDGWGGYTLTLKNAENLPGALTPFGETGRLVSYLEDARYPLKSPLGIYIAYKHEGVLETPIAILSCGYPEQDDNGLSISEMTDVLKAFQSKGYGSLIRSETAKYVAGFFGQKIYCNMNGEMLLSESPLYCNMNGEMLLSESPLSSIDSCCEWSFGHNHPSLISSIRAGFGIVDVDSSGHLLMKYSSDEKLKASFWSQDKVEAIIKFSIYVMQISAHSHSAVIEADTKAASEGMLYVLQNLDLEREIDIYSFLSISQRVLTEAGHKWLNKTGDEEGYASAGCISHSSASLVLYQNIYTGLCDIFKCMDAETFSRIGRLATPELFCERHQRTHHLRWKAAVFRHFEAMRLLGEDI